MKRTLSLLSLLLFLVLSAPAQNLVFHLGGGLASHYGGSTRNIGAFKIGLGYEIEMNGLWSIEPGIVYFAKGWKDKDSEVTVYDDEGNVVYDDNGNAMRGEMNVTSNTNYIEVPVLFNYYVPLGSPHYLAFSAGPYVAIGVGGKAKTSGDTEQEGAARYYYEHSTFDQPDMHRFDAGITVGISYELNRQFDAGVRADFGLANVSRSGAKNIAVLLSFAYRLGM